MPTNKKSNGKKSNLEKPKVDEPLIKFPCDFIVKVMGKNSVDFQNHVVAIVMQHYPSLNPDTITTRPSKDEKYISLTVTVHAESQQQLDALYQDLSDDPEVLMAL